jgi:hypothetical protein
VGLAAQSVAKGELRDASLIFAAYGLLSPSPLITPRPSTRHVDTTLHWHDDHLKTLDMLCAQLCTTLKFREDTGSRNSTLGRLNDEVAVEQVLK